MQFYFILELSDEKVNRNGAPFSSVTLQRALLSCIAALPLHLSNNPQVVLKRLEDAVTPKVVDEKTKREMAYYPLQVTAEAQR